MYRQQFPDDPGMHNMPRSHRDGSSRARYREASPLRERIVANFLPIGLGCILIVGAVVLLFLNEGRAVQTARSLDEALSIVRPLHHSEVISVENEGKLVHLTGPLRTDEPIYDDVFGISLHAVKLRRIVEMYQWVEHSHTSETRVGGQVREETTYTYDESWRQDLIPSGSFNSPYLHENPTSMPYTSQDFVASEVYLGSFKLSQDLISKMSDFKSLHLQQTPKIEGLKLISNVCYLSDDPRYPQVGDVRIYFEYVGSSGEQHSGEIHQDSVSVIGRQYEGKLSAYQTDAGNEIELIYSGEHSAASMLGREQMSNAFITWGLRFAGWLLMFVGFGCMTSILNTLVQRLPLIREAVGLSSPVISAVLSISLSLLVIAAGWIRFRPLLGLTCLALSLLPFIITKIRGPRLRSYQNAQSYRNYFD